MSPDRDLVITRDIAVPRDKLQLAELAAQL